MMFSLPQVNKLMYNVDAVQQAFHSEWDHPGGFMFKHRPMSIQVQPTNPD